MRERLGRLYRGDTAIDFHGKRRIGYLISGVLIVASVVSLFTQELELGIDFRGGVAWEVKAPDASVDDARDALRPLGLANAKIQVLGGDTLRVQAGAQTDATEEEVTEALARLAGVDFEEVGVNEVGPAWGDAITEKAERALLFFFAAIALYIALRFEWKMAIAALVAVVHDIILTVGIYSVFRFEVTPATVIAFLTILGYSLYDTVVVFDKVQENVARSSAGRDTYAGIVNRSMNQVLMRSVNTTVTSLLPVISLLFVGSFALGAVTLRDFALALLVGMLTGAYSSIFVAAPILVTLKEREPRYAAIRERLASRPPVSGGPRSQPVVVGAPPAGDTQVERPAPPRPGYGGSIPPRPRKKKRR